MYTASELWVSMAEYQANEIFQDLDGRSRLPGLSLTVGVLLVGYDIALN
jgi:hypothetical protein